MHRTARLVQPRLSQIEHFQSGCLSLWDAPLGTEPVVVPCIGQWPVIQSRVLDDLLGFKTWMQYACVVSVMNTLPTVVFGLTRVWIVFWVRDL